jgi:hypothetical protein
VSQSSFALGQMEQLIARASEIKDARDNLHRLVESWNRDFPQIQLEVNVGSLKFMGGTDNSSIDDKIVKHLDANPDRKFNANMLHDELQIPPSSLGTQLSKLFRTHRIARLGRGYYCSRLSAMEGIEEEEKEATEVAS